MSQRKSVYATFDEGPQSELSVQRVALKRKRAATPAGAADADAGKHQRRAQPAEKPLPATFKWMARLPAAVRPLALLRAYPRVANMLASSWADPAMFRATLYDLLVDRRGTRKGFEGPVVAELLALRAWYDDFDRLRRPRASRAQP